MKKTISITFLALILYTVEARDILTLSNEMVFEGKVLKIKDCMVTFKSNKIKYKVPASDIFSIQFGNIEDKVYTKYLNMTKHKTEECFRGITDAENYHKKKGGHFVLGLLFGPFAMLGTAIIANPTPEKGRLTYSKSENIDQFNDPEYLGCYRKKARLQLLAAETLGWVISTILLAALEAGR